MSGNLPAVGEKWIKPSYPIPTVVEVASCDGDRIVVKLGRGGRRELSVLQFLAQGFEKKEG